MTYRRFVSAIVCFGAISASPATIRMLGASALAAPHASDFSKSDVAGVKLGMSLAEVRSILKASASFKKFTEEKPSLGPGAPAALTASISSILAVVGPSKIGELDVLRVFFTLGDQQQVVRVARSKTYASSAPGLTKELLDAMKEKYGAPTFRYDDVGPGGSTGGHHLIWQTKRTVSPDKGATAIPLECIPPDALSVRPTDPHATSAACGPTYLSVNVNGSPGANGGPEVVLSYTLDFYDPQAHVIDAAKVQAALAGEAAARDKATVERARKVKPDL